MITGLIIALLFGTAATLYCCCIVSSHSDRYTERIKKKDEIKNSNTEKGKNNWLMK